MAGAHEHPVSLLSEAYQGDDLLVPYQDLQQEHTPGMHNWYPVQACCTSQQHGSSRIYIGTGTYVYVAYLMRIRLLMGPEAI